MPHVITITGPSMAGKSTTVEYLLEYKSTTFRPELVRKYTTRPQRKDIDREVACVKVIPPECDLVYDQYGYRYGLESRTLVELIANGFSPVVILNDVRAVEDVRNAFRERVRSIFIFRHDPLSEKYHQELLKTRGDQDGKIRFEKAKTIYRIYIENIQLFDHVIINSGTKNELRAQVGQIVKSLGY